MSNYYKKEQKIPYSYYNDIFIQVKILTDKYLNKEKNPFNVVAVDGTYTNTNLHNNKKLETCLNMGYYDSTNHIPIQLEIKGTEYKNKEIESFVNYIKTNNMQIENLILVFDILKNFGYPKFFKMLGETGPYFSYEFIKILELHKLNYVIRGKNNCKCINDKKKLLKN